MKKRRTSIKTASLAATTIAINQMPGFSQVFTGDEKFRFMRPPLKDRKFVSEAVEHKLISAKKMIRDEELAWMFENCFPNTLDTTVTTATKNGRPDTFVITGDIDAMWLRDSSAQVWPYLPLMKNDKKLQDMIAGVVNRHADYVLIDL